MFKFNCYVSLNLLSILGLIFFVYFFITIIIALSQGITIGGISSENTDNGLLAIYAVTTGIFAIIEYIIMLLFVIEFLIYRFKKTEPRFIKIPEKFKKIHFLFLCFGVFVALFPAIGFLTTLVCIALN